MGYPPVRLQLHHVIGGEEYWIGVLDTVRRMMTWGNKERLLLPAHVFMRPLTHIYHHQGQIVAM